MTDLERKLAEALREQAGEVTPNLDAAWAEQQRRQRRPQRRRRASVWIAPLAAVLVVLTSVLVATQLNAAAPVPAPPANPGQELVLAEPVFVEPVTLSGGGEPVRLVDFAGQTDAWTSYAVNPADPTGRPLFCVEALGKGTNHGTTGSQFGIKSPSCAPLSAAVVHAGYVGETGGPLPAGKAVYLVDPAVRQLRLYDAAGDLSQAQEVGALGRDRVFLADVTPGSPPVRFDVSSTPAPPASR
jgi:hypothetical protein